MSLTPKENLMKYAEETAYSSKGHFKTADFTKLSLRFFIGVPIVLTIILIVYTDIPQWGSRLLNCVGLISSVLALASPLVNNQDRAGKIIDEHMSLGNSYLELHKKIRNISTQETITIDQLNEITTKMTELDNKSRDLHIGAVGRLWSKFRIQKEMDLGWIKRP